MEEAEALYEVVLAEDPRHPRALAGLSRALTARDDFRPAVELARRAIQAVRASPDPSGRALGEARLALGEAHFRAGDLEEAGIAFRQALAADPELAPAWHGLARYALTVPRYQEAGLCLRRADALDPGDPRVIRRLAGLVASRQEVQGLYRRYLELPPAEGPERYANTRAWLALLEAAGDHKLYRLESPPGRHELRLRRLEGLPLIDVRIGGGPVRPFLLDSGAGGVIISAALAKHLALEQVDGFALRGISADTESRPLVLLPRLEIGPFIFHDVPAVVAGSMGEVRGIIGLSMLAPLHPVLEGFRTVGLERDAAPREGCPAGDWWRVRNIGGQLRVTGRLAGDPVHLLVDTGASRSMLARSALERLGLAESPRAAGTGITGVTGAARQVGRVRDRASLTVFGRQTSVRGMPVLDLGLLSRSLGTEIDGILGVDLLGGRRFTFDYAAGRMRVEAPTGASR